VVRLPELTIEERARLTESICQDGVQYPVLVDALGQVIVTHRRDVEAHQRSSTVTKGQP
jgi:hypothetical protein